MGSRYDVEVTITSAKDLKNVNWRYGPLRPYVVVWIDPNNKCSTRVDEEGDQFPVWDQTLHVPLPPGGRVEDQTLYIDIVHARRGDEDTKPLIGSARLKLAEVSDEAGYGERVKRSVQVKRPSGRPHGKVEVKVSVRDSRSRGADPYYAPPYGVGPPAAQVSSRDYYAAPQGAYGAPYSAAPQPGYAGSYSAPAPPQSSYYGAAQPPSGYPYSGGYAQQSTYGQGQGQGQGSYGYVEEKKKSKFGGMGTGLAVGAVAGALGGLALAEGFDALENKITDDVADKVEDDVAYDDDW